MTADRRLERDLAQQLTELYVQPLPDYRDDLIGRIAATSQRPAWTLPGRWLPMSVTTSRLATAPPVRWRTVAVLALLIVALVATTILVIGSRQRRLPEPFGPASNGVIPFVSAGDIYVGDPVTGATRLLVGGPEGDALPQFSPDGTRIAFIRDVGSGTGHVPVDIWVVRDDGSDLRRITSQPIADWLWIAWTPDGRHLAVVSTVDASTNQLDLIDATGNGSVETIATAAGMDFVQFRPPDGREILYRALKDGKWGLFAMDADGTNPRTLAEPSAPADIGLSFYWSTYSADGSRIFYNRGTSNGCCRLWVMNADGIDPHEFVPRSGLEWDGQPAVSPDGTRVAYWYNANDGGPHGIAVVRADGTGPVIETGPKLNDTAHWVWAPDSSKILMYPNDDSSPYAYLLDPEGGPWTTVPWQSDGDLDWQRRATD